MVHKISNIEEPSKDWSIRYRKPCLVQTFTKKKNGSFRDHFQESSLLTQLVQ